MRLLPRFGIFVLVLAAGFGGQTWAAKSPVKHPHKKAATRVSQPEPPITDSSSVAAWRKKLPWTYRDSAFSVYRDTLLRPLFTQNNLGPGNLFKRGGFVEIVFPRGRPLHEYAWQVESQCAKTGLRILDGHEFDPPEERIEYHLRAAAAEPLALRLTLGKTVLHGTARMALVIVSLDSIQDDAAKKLLAFPISLTLALPVDSTGVAHRWSQLPDGKKALLELPMEPSNYPYVKPGFDALFIHHTSSEVEKLLKRRIQSYPSAIGFATTFGDRAIENRPLLTHVLAFTAEKSLLFLDLTASSRSLTASVALQTGAVAFSARLQKPDAEDKLEAELVRRCNLAGKTGEGIWVLRYAPELPDLLGKLLEKNREHFTELGLQWVTLDHLHRSKNPN